MDADTAISLLRTLLSSRYGIFDRYYSATIIKMSGVKSDEAAVWLSAVTAAVNFVFTFVGLYLVERIGRRPLTIASLLGEIIGGVIFSLAQYSTIPYLQM